MALINCPECEKEISDQAVACPHCGYQMSEEITQNAEVSKEEETPPKKGRVKKAILVLVPICLIVLAGVFAVNYFNGDKAVEFKVLGENDVPTDIVEQVIPEYRDLERALACMVNDKVYVFVSRGEKPTSGFDLNIEKLVVEENDGVTCLAVYANFADPEPGVALTQILTYPCKVAETELTQLPDQVELRVQYKE